MYAVVTFIIVAVISMLFTRIATGALIATGLPSGIATFQARSAFTGTGFTTSESESVVNHPVRRRILGTTMLVGNLGTPTLVVTVLISLIGPGPGDSEQRLLAIVIGLAVTLGLVSLPPVTRALIGVGERYARQRLLPAVGHEAVEVLGLGDGFVVAEVAMAERPPLGPRSLRGLDAALPGLRLLGVRRTDDDGVPRFFGEPPEDLDLGPSDVLVVSGPRSDVAHLAAAGLRAG